MNVRIRAMIATVLIVAGGTASTIAQSVGNDNPDVGRRQVIPFLEGTRVLHHLRFDTEIDRPAAESPALRFEADIQPNLVVSQNFLDKLEIEQTLEQRRTRFAYSIVGTPRVRLRMFNSRSAPVRTPSYMPRLSVTGLFMRGAEGRVGTWAGQLTLGHHSNGQDGCLFETDVLVDGECTGPADPKRINFRDGSFSTNFVKGGARYRATWLRDEVIVRTPTVAGGSGTVDRVGFRELTVGADLELHFGTDQRVRPYYGTRRAEAYAGGAITMARLCRSRASAQVTVRYVGRSHADVDPFVFQADGTCTFSDRGGWGIFVRYYRGQDYYNLGFNQSLSRLQFGFHYENDGFLRFVSREVLQRQRSR